MKNSKEFRFDKARRITKKETDKFRKAIDMKPPKLKNIKVDKAGTRRPSTLKTELAQDNRQYRNRLLYGASWRADIITAIEDGAKTPFEISKKLGCSYEPAHRVFREYRLAHGDEAA